MKFCYYPNLCFLLANCHAILHSHPTLQNVVANKTSISMAPANDISGTQDPYMAKTSVWFMPTPSQDS